MLTNSLMVECTSCSNLKTLYHQIDDRIYHLIKTKWYNNAYNTDGFFDGKLYRKLIRYKKLIGKRIFNGKYPNATIDVQDIITQATLLINK